MSKLLKENKEKGIMKCICGFLPQEVSSVFVKKLMGRFFHREPQTAAYSSGKTNGYLDTVLGQGRTVA